MEQRYDEREDQVEEVGRRITAVRGTSRLTGVLLPSLAPDAPLRLHVDGQDVVDLDPSDWTFQTEAPVRPKRSQRRTQCSNGRPLYRYDDLPNHQLATASMLKCARLRPAQDQLPIASYWTGYQTVPLYAVADTTPMAALSPARQAAWDRARTCARCGSGPPGPYADPYATGVDGARYCGPCHEPAAEAHWKAQRASGRAAAIAWAAGVLADPATVLVESRNSRLHVETLDGEVLVSALLRSEPIPDWWPREDKDRYTNAALIVDQVRALACRRLVSAWDGVNGLPVNALMRDVGVADVDLAVAEGDVFRKHWDEWIGERLPYGSLEYRRNQQLNPQDLPGDPAELAAFMRQGLATMAAAGQEAPE